MLEAARWEHGGLAALLLRFRQLVSGVEREGRVQLKFKLQNGRWGPGVEGNWLARCMVRDGTPQDRTLRCSQFTGYGHALLERLAGETALLARDLELLLEWWRVLSSSI